MERAVSIGLAFVPLDEDVSQFYVLHFSTSNRVIPLLYIGSVEIQQRVRERDAPGSFAFILRDILLFGQSCIVRLHRPPGSLRQMRSCR